MAAHTVAIAKASLAAGFMRPDPRSISREQISHFHSLLDSTLARCSPANIQRCRRWLSENVASSAGRVTAIGKYLVALSSSYNQSGSSREEASRPSGRRRQLHILYILSDLLHSSKYHSSSSTAFVTFTANVQPHLFGLFAQVGVYERSIYHRQHTRVSELIAEWERHQYFHTQFFEKLRGAVDSASTSSQATDVLEDNALALDNNAKSKRDAPYVMPATHGDPMAPFHELPAATMMPHIVPNSATPINSGNIRALQFMGGPAEVALTEAVKSFLKEADKLYGASLEDDEGISMELDDIGQSVYRDKTTGDVVGGDSYYGWSKTFCEQMKRKMKELINQSPSPGRSSSREGGGSPQKRRRSTSSRSLSRSRSRSPPPRFGGRANRSPYSRSRSRSRSRTPPRFRRGRDRSRSYSPARRNSPPRASQQPPRGLHPPPPPPPPVGQDALPPSIPFGSPFPNVVPIGPGGLPIPPPRPPNYHGPWPPPPPPPPMGSSGSPQAYPPFAAPPPPPPPMSAQGFQGPSPPRMQGWAPPPPPPPPQQSYQESVGYGESSGPQYGDPRRNNRGRGRGGGWR
ncbi:MAG: hypothetical protein MMC23_001549 [Stictis urceolatum]|nr:hypothetical protein [Stictis urceolata]